MLKIKNYLESYEDFFQVGLGSLLYDLTLAEACADDFFDMFNPIGDNKMIHISYVGTSDYFAVIYVGKHKYKDNLDEYPIYVFDNEKESFEYVGNFKVFMERYLVECESNLGQKSIFKRQKYAKQIKSMRSELHQFSDKTIKLTKPIIKPVD
jgi:hypothetical protein